MSHPESHQQNFPAAFPIAQSHLVYFHASLECVLDESADAQRRLTTLEDGALQVEFTLKLPTLHSAWEAAYTFDLFPAAVDRIDALEAKLCQQQNELENLRDDQGNASSFIEFNASEEDVGKQQNELENLREDQGNASSFIEFKASEKYVGTSTLFWYTNLPDEHVLSCGGGVIEIRRQGVYVIDVVVKCEPKDGEDENSVDDDEENYDDDEGSGFVQLWKNNECIQVDYFAARRHLPSHAFEIG
ncbi:hypothetical protein PRNP1_012204 [Phytophthora ramorum]